MLARLVEQGGRSVRVRRLGGSRAGEIQLTRFLRNDAVSVEEMLAEASRRTAQRCQGRHVLAIQDTTALQSEGGGGQYLHAVIAVDAEDDAILGLIGAQFLQRSQGRSAARHGLPVEQKESFRWLQGADEAASVCAGAPKITVIEDREGDLYEAFALRPDGVELLIRAAQDRSLGEGGRLFAAVDALTEVSRAEIDLPAKPGRKPRTAAFALRIARVQLARPKDGLRTGLAASVAVQVVDVRELDPPPGEAPVHWRLLTTHAAQTAADGWRIVELYRRRWAIEQLFRTLKTRGFDIEDILVEHPGAREKLVAATVIAAVAIQQLVHGRERGPGRLRPCTDVFQREDLPLLDAFCTKFEGKTARQKNPHPKGSLPWASWICARAGGWTGYYGKPGPIVMLEGWLEIQAAKRGIAMITSGHDV